MITKIEIDGFKSFSQFEMEFTPLTVIAGTNASGKSNLFDALHLLASLTSHDLRTAFSDKSLRGEVSELFTKYDDQHCATRMNFAVEMLVERHVTDNWESTAEIKTPRMRYELSIERRTNELGYDELTVAHEQLSNIKYADDAWAKSILGNKNKNIWGSGNRGGGGGKPYIATIEENGLSTIRMRQDGKQGGKSIRANVVNQTVLGSVNSVDFPHVFAAKQEMNKWNFMQLNPEMLREPTRYDVNYTGSTIGHAGENLAAALFRLKSENEENLDGIVLKLSSFLPEYTKLDVKDDKANKQFVFTLENSDGTVFTSRVLSEGTLRLLVLCVLLNDKKFQGLLCFEEPENGIHPYRLEAMAQLLRSLAADFEEGEETSLRQVIVNTHSPALLQLFYDMSKEGKGMNIWFSRLVTRITSIGDHRYTLRISKVTPLLDSPQYTIPIEEHKWTYADAMRFLNKENTK